MIPSIKISNLNQSQIIKHAHTILIILEFENNGIYNFPHLIEVQIVLKNLERLLTIRTFSILQIIKT